MRKLIAVLLVCGCSSTSYTGGIDAETGGSSQTATSVVSSGGDVSTGGGAAVTGGSAGTGGARMTGGAATTGGANGSGGTQSSTTDCEFSPPLMACGSGASLRACHCSDFAGDSAYCASAGCTSCPDGYKDCDGIDSNGCEAWTAGQGCP